MTRLKDASVFYTIPSGTAFAQALAKGILKRASAPEELPRYRILLPTRRACRTLQEAFLNESNGRPLMLPRMSTIGDVDQDELSLLLHGEREVDIPPAISPLQRRILLGRAIMGLEGWISGPAQALALAEALGRFMDHVYTEGIDFSALSGLVPDEFARHWQITLSFLTILTQIWPDILAERGVIDAADRRNRLIRALADYWKSSPPDGPVIAAGSTGSIPATAELLSVVSRLPQGCVVLPGLDREMDEKSWDVIDETHPQAQLKKLLIRTGVQRAQVRTWPDDSVMERENARRLLAREIMRPAETAERWHEDAFCASSLKPALENLLRYDCDTPHEESSLIAVILRETLEQRGRTAALITPDRALARRVAAACRRWGIAIDDSGGRTLESSAAGSFLCLILEALKTQVAPVSLLALLHHEHCTLGMEPSQRRRERAVLDAKILRGPKPCPGFSGIETRIAELRQTEELKGSCETLLQRTRESLASLLSLPGGHATLPEWIDALVASAEALSRNHHEETSTLWSGEDGEAASAFLAELRSHAHLLGPVDAGAFLSCLTQMMREITIRPAWGTHPRLSILGQLEARLVQTDIVILGGLNEGSWPPDPGHDPWMSRPMRKKFGLPAPERAIGLAAHDFIQGFCAERVILTRACRKGRAPTVPARWLQRLDTVLEAAGFSLAQGPHRTLAARLDAGGIAAPLARPDPRPALRLRPDSLSVTRIETWLRDPYAIYAEKILRLRKLEPLEKEPDAADRGTVLHDILDRFTAETMTGLPPDALNRLLGIARNVLETRSDDPALWSFWWPRFLRLSEWFMDHETAWRERARPIAREVKGTMKMGNFTLTAKADRIDRFHTGGAAIIDYKSGGAYTAGKIASGEQPQLPLEALILESGGFEGIAPMTTEELSYWILTGSRPPGKTETAQTPKEILDRARDGLEALIRAFAREEAPYYSLPVPDRAPRFNDYEHLARVREWTALGESAEDGDAS